jgi:hypothetical protein
MAQEKQPSQDFIRVFSTPQPGEIALIKSLLEAEGIPYFVKGEHFGTLYGPADGMSSIDVMVHRDYVQEAAVLLKDFISPSKANPMEDEV